MFDRSNELFLCGCLCVKVTTVVLNRFSLTAGFCAIALCQMWRGRRAPIKAGPATYVQCLHLYINRRGGAGYL